MKNKGYANKTCINFASCCAVAYLELQYPTEYNAIIKKESEFAEIVSKSYSIRNIKDVESRKSSLTEAVENFLVSLNVFTKDNLDNLKNDLVKMMLNGEIDNDFRMYFYSYPKGSYIKTSAEKDISNLLLLPSAFPSDDALNEKINEIVSTNKEKSIISLLQKISIDSQLDSYPAIILYDKYLFEHAIPKKLKIYFIARHLGLLTKWNTARKRYLIFTIITVSNKMTFCKDIVIGY